VYQFAGGSQTVYMKPWSWNELYSVGSVRERPATGFNLVITVATVTSTVMTVAAAATIARR
jgi:hypothetical protein